MCDWGSPDRQAALERLDGVGAVAQAEERALFHDAMLSGFSSVPL
jgi:hypothetical protein